MSLTIGRKRSHRSPPGDTVRLCSYCGIAWYRSQLRRDASGNLACPDDQRGLDVVTLSEGNISGLAERRDLGSYTAPSDGTVDSPSTDVAPPLNWNGPSPMPPPNAGPLGVISVPIQAWWRGDSFLAGPGSNTVFSMVDLSGFGNDLASIGTSLPTRSVQTFGNQNQGYFGFNGVAARSYAPMRCTSGALWMWFVIRQNAWVGGSAMFNCGCSITQQVSSPTLRMQTGGANNAGAPLAAWTRGIASFSTGGTDDLRLGSTQTSNAAAGLRIGTTFIMGANSIIGTAPLGFSVADFQVYQGAPTAAEQAALDAYGLARYGNTVTFG